MTDLAARREHLAAMAMQAMITRSAFREDELEEFAKHALRYADALIAELDRTE